MTRTRTARTLALAIFLPALALADGPSVGYEKGFFIRSSDGFNLLRVQARVQARYTYELLEDAGDESQLSIPRARMTLAGKLFNPALGYKFQTDFGKGGVRLKDFYIDYDVDSLWLRVRVGQFKRTFSRQQLTSSSRLALVDRALTDKAFGAGRDIGITLMSNYSKAPFEYAVGVFNGTGDNQVPDQFNPTLVVRLGYNHNGVAGYSEADLEGGPFRFAVAANALVDFDAFDETDTPNIRVGADYALKVHGFATTGGFYVATAGTELGDQEMDRMGFHAQASYLIADRYLPVVRAAMLLPEGDDDNVSEYQLGFSVFFWGHQLKWQTDATIRMSEQAGADDRLDVIIRTQAQLGF